MYQQAAKELCTANVQHSTCMRLLGVNMTSVKNTLRAIPLDRAVNSITQKRIMDRQKLLHSTDRPP